MSTQTSNIETELGNENSWLEVVRQQVKSLRFGVVQIVIHESRVVQIERTEKLRLDPAVASPTPTRTPGGSNKH